MVLIVDPQTKTIREYRSLAEIRVYDNGKMDLQDVLPEFELDVTELCSYVNMAFWPNPRCLMDCICIL